MKSVNRSFAAVLAACLLLSCAFIAPAVRADSPVTLNGAGYGDLASAFADAATGDIIVIHSDVTVESTIGVTRNVILLSDGSYRVNGGAVGEGPVFDIRAGGTLTVSGYTVFTCGSDRTFFNVSGGTLNVRGDVEFKSCGAAVSLVSGVCNLAGGVFSGNGAAVKVGGSSSGLRISGSVSFGKDDVISLPSGGRIFITDELTGTGDIPVSVVTGKAGTVIAELASSDVSLSEDQAARFTVRFPGGTAGAVLDGSTVKIAEKGSGNDPDTTEQTTPAVTTEDPNKPDPVARIGDIGYADLHEAFAAASGSGGTVIVLLSDVTLDRPVRVSGSVTLVSEGDHTVKRKKAYTGILFETAKNSVFSVGASGGSLTISGDKVEAVMPVVKCEGTVTLGGKVTISGAINKNSSLLYQGTVFVPSGGVLKLNGAKITGNSASAGAGIMLYGGTVEIYSGEIGSNTAKKGGGIYVYSGKLDIRGGSISGNKASEEGGAIYCSGSLRLSGSASVPGKEKAGENDIFLSKGRSISLDPAWAPKEGVLTVTPAEPEIGAVVAAAERGTADPDIAKFRLSSGLTDDYELAAEKGRILIAAVPVYVAYIGKQPYTSLKEAVAAVPADGKEAVITVVRDIEFTETVAIPAGTAIEFGVGRDEKDKDDYAQRTFKRGPEFDKAFFTVDAEASVTFGGTGEKLLVFDGSAVPASEPMLIVSGTLSLTDGVTLTGNSVTVNEDLNAAEPVLKDGGAIAVTATGTLDMKGGVIEKNYAARGGGVCVLDGIFTLSGGDIKENRALYGGGVYIGNTLTLDNVTPPDPSAQPAEEQPHGVLTMTGGSITGNTVVLQAELAFPAGQGGGVYISNAATFAASGGAVSGNTAVLGSGVYAGTVPAADEPAVRVPVFEISGEVVFAENDLYLTATNASVVTVTGALTGVTAEAPATVTIPDILSQNSSLIKYAIPSNTPEQNAAAAKAAAEAGIFKLSGDAAEYYVIGQSTGDAALLINISGAREYLGYSAGRSYNGLPGYQLNADGTPSREPVKYDPITIFDGGCFTVSFEFSYYLNLFPNLRSELVGAFPKGTKFTLVSFNDPEHPACYYYETTGTEEVLEAAEPDSRGVKSPDTIVVPLGSFMLMSDNRTHYGEYEEGYVPPTDPKAITRECLTVVVDFSDAELGDNVTLSGPQVMRIRHVYPGPTDDIEYDITENFKAVEYTVGKKTESQIMVTSDLTGVTVSYILDEGCRTVEAGCGAIKIELAHGGFPEGTAAKVGERVYPVAPLCGWIIIPVPSDETGALMREGTVRVDVMNYFGRAVMDATIRAVVYPSSDGTHVFAGTEYDAASEGVAYTLSARDEWAISVTDENGVKPSYSYSRESAPDIITITVKAKKNGENVSSVRLTLEDGDHDFKSIPLSTLFVGIDDSDGNGAELLTSSTVTLKPRNGAPRGEYRLAFKAGDKTEYVKLIIN